MGGGGLAVVLAALAVLAESAPVAADPIDFRIVSRPKHWGGLELPGKPASTQQRRLHGAVKSHLHKLEGAPKGYVSYRVYFIKDYAKVQNVYARESQPNPSARRLMCELSRSGLLGGPI